MRRSLVGWWLLAVSAALWPLASSADFDAATGMVSMEGALCAHGFESGENVPCLKVLNFPAGDPLSAAELDGMLTTEAPIEGQKSLRLHRSFTGLGLNPTWDLSGQRIEVVFWARMRGVEPSLTLTWFRSGGSVHTLLVTQTGRRTDDGWVELTTGPIDALLGGLARLVLILRVEASSYFYGPASDAYAQIDAFQILDRGEAAVPARECRVVTEREDCGPVGVCLVGQCVDGTAVYGRMPTGAIKDAYLDRRIFEVANFDGHSALTQTYSVYLSAMERARSAGTAWEFWTAVGDAYEALGDTHASPPIAHVQGYDLADIAGVCLHLGEADLLPADGDGQAPKAPLVFYIAPDSMFASTLEVGDALVSIDGLAPMDWVASARGSVRSAGSPGSRDVVLTPSIFPMAVELGSKLVFERCAVSDEPCVPRRIDIDARELFRSGFYGVTAWSKPYGPNVGCDFRFWRPVKPGGNRDRPVTDSAWAAAEDVDGVRVLGFNGLPSIQTGDAWSTTVGNALKASASRFMLDVRTGHGGVGSTVDKVMAPFFSGNSGIVMEQIPTNGRWVYDEAEAERYRACAASPYAYMCGIYQREFPGSAYPESLNQVTDAPVAILFGMDVSANDFLPRYLRFRGPKTRIFGPASSMGAFGGLMTLPGYLGELDGGSVQGFDAIFYIGTTAGVVFESGPGVTPDVTVFQKQSDLLLNVDTVFETAKAWLLAQ